VRNYQCHCALTVDMDWALYRHSLDGPCYAHSILRKRMRSCTCCRPRMCECCSGCNTLQNFGLHSNFAAFLGLSLIVANTQAHSMSSLKVLFPLFLVGLTVIFGHVLLLCNVCKHFLVVSKVSPSINELS